MDNNTKNAEALRELLLDFELQIVQGISAELERIGRAVSLNEIDYSPFADEVLPYVIAIRLSIRLGGLNEAVVTHRKVILDCSFSDLPEKDLTSFISDGEINYWDLIMLLELLQEIKE